MIKSITISGDRDMIIRLDEFKKDISRLQEPLEEAGRFMQEEAKKNFPARGAIFGERWPGYARAGWRVSPKGRRYWFPGTLAIKAAKGFGGKPLMVRTGLLKESFHLNGPHIDVGGGWIEVFNPVDYASLHQEGVGKLPRRVLLKLAKRQTDKILEKFTRWMVKKIDKNFKGI